MLAQAWEYRNYIVASVLREFQARYKGSALGFFWAIFNPLSQILVYTLVFAEVMRVRLPGATETFAYSIHLCAGLLPWLWFSEIINRSTTMFIDNANILKKSAFPRICLPLIVFFSSLINFLIMFAIFLLVLVFTGFLSWHVLAWVPPLVLVLALMGVGIGLILGTLNVFARDIGQFQLIVTQLWFWLTPIVWPLTAVPQDYRSWLALNPVAPIIGQVQGVILQARPPALVPLSSSLVFTLVVLLLGFVLFRGKAADIADEL